MSDTSNDKANDALEIAESHAAAKEAGWWDVVRSRSFPNQEVPAPTLCAFRDGYAAAKLKYRVVQSASGWISVKERLPEQAGRYIVSVKPILGEKFSTTTSYTPQEHAYINGWNISGVTDWQPLPEARK